MNRDPDMSAVSGGGGGWRAEAWAWSATRPVWATRVVLLAVIVIVGLPALLLLLAALLGGSLIIALTALLGEAAGRLQRVLRRDGRQNVRVVRRGGR